MNKRFLAITLAGSTLLLPQASLASDMLTLVKQALSKHPAVQEKLEKVNLQHQQTVEARGGYYPTITMELQRGPEQSDNASLNATGNSDDVLFRQEDTIKLTQMVYDGGQTYYTVANKKHTEQENKYAYQEQYLLTAREAIEAYLNVLRSRKLVALSEKNLAIHKTSQDKIAARTESGLGHRADLELAKARHAFAATQLSQNKETLANSIAKYRRLFGELPKKLHLPKLPSIPHTPKAALDMLEANNNTLKLLNARSLAGHDEVHVRQAEFIPHIALEGTMYRARNRQGSRGFDHNTRALVDVSYTPLNGGADLAKLKQAKSRLIGDEKAFADQHRELINMTIDLYHADKAHRQRLGELKQYAKATAQAAEDYQQQFTIGKQDVFSLLDAEKEKFNAKASLINEQYDQLIDRYKILELLGTLFTKTTHQDKHA